MKVTIHQPTYLPYLGVFSKVASADVFVIYDTAQYEKGSVHNRQRIRTAQGELWLTIPLKESLTAFKDTHISYGNLKQPWYETHWKSIEQNYKKTPFFERYSDELYRLYHENHPSTLMDFNMRFIRLLLREFNIQKKIVLFSELTVDQSLSPSEKLAVAVEKLGGTHYVSGPSGKHYLDLAPFDVRGIDVSFFEFNHPTYAQYHMRYDNKFMPNMGSIDALLNTGSMPTLSPSKMTVIA